MRVFDPPFTGDQFDQTLDSGGGAASGQVRDVLSDNGIATGSRADSPAAEPRKVPPIRPDRAFVLQNLSAALIGALKNGIRRVLVQQPVRLPTGDIARPDICVLCEAAASSSKSRRRRDAIQLIVEVSNDASQYELDKLARYALGRVPEVWIVDLARHRFLVHQAPAGISFAKRQLLVAPERMRLLQVPNVELKVAWIFAERD